MESPEGNVAQDHFKQIEKLVQRIVKEKQPFQRVVLTKPQALEMFKFNKFKQELISEKIPNGATCTAYRCGPLIDLCRGPHIPNTSIIKSMALVKNSSAYWKNDSTRENL